MNEALVLIPVENFPQPMLAAVFTILFFIVLLTELRILLRLSGDTKTDRRSFHAIALALVIWMISLFVFAYANFGRVSHAISYIGFILLILGFILRQWSIMSLESSFTPEVKVRPDQKLLTKGPYRLIRHPSYTGLLLEVLGASLTISNGVSAFVGLFMLLPALVYRMRVEEKMLRDHFNEEYTSYRLRTKKLIPFLY